MEPAKRFEFTVKHGGKSPFTIIGRVSPGDDLVQSGFSQIQRNIFDEKFTTYEGDFNNVKSMIRHIYPLVPHHFEDIITVRQLINKIIPLYKVRIMYDITGIKEIPDCEGCQYDSPGQDNHTDCPSGCLHTSIYCDVCSTSNVNE